MISIFLTKITLVAFVIRLTCLKLLFVSDKDLSKNMVQQN